MRTTPNETGSPTGTAAAARSSIRPPCTRKTALAKVQAAAELSRAGTKWASAVFWIAA